MNWVEAYFGQCTCTKEGKTWSSLLCFFRQDRVCEEKQQHSYFLEVLLEVEIRSDTNSYAFQVAYSGEEEGEEKEKLLVVSNMFLESLIVTKIDDFEV
jgi:hypothetical protein